MFENRIKILFAFLLLLSISFLGNKVREKKSDFTIIDGTNSIESNLRKFEFPKKPVYEIKAKYDWEKQSLRCSVNIKTDSAFIKNSSLFFILPANGLKSNRTYYSANFHFTKENFTQFKFDKISVNGYSALFEYKTFAEGFDLDSTLLEIKLPKNIRDSISVLFEYSLKVPRGDYLFGVSEHKNFSVLRGFYPTLLFPSNRLFNFTSNGIEDYPPADFNVSFQISDKVKILNPEFKLNSSGNYFQIDKSSREVVLFLSQKNEPIVKDSVIINDLKVNIFSVSASNSYIPRIKKGVKNSVEYFSRIFNNHFPGSFTIVDLPRSMRLKNIYTSRVTAFHTDLFSPVWTKHPEGEVIKGIFTRSVGGDFITDYADFPWLLYGIREFLTDEIFLRYYGKISQSFKLVSYLPIKGETMFAYNEIPIIYRLNSFEYEPWQDKVYSYLSMENKVGFFQPAGKMISAKQYNFISEIKPALALQVLKNYFGRESVNAVISRFRRLSLYNGFADESNFNSALSDVIGKRGVSIWKSLSNSSGNINYTIDGLSKLYGNKYLLRLSKNGNIEFPIKILVYTKQDTLKFLWEGKKRIKEIVFSSENEVLGAELDPENFNILDINRADNSYLVNGNYSTAFAYAIHWFFWVQNALMMFGVFG